MTQSNPYKYDSNADDDLFESDEPAQEKKAATRKKHRHTLDGTVCHTCNVVHAVHGLPDNLPAHVIEKILDFIDRIPDDILRKADGLLAAAVPPQAKLVINFMDFLVETDDVNQDGPLIRAIAEHLDEQTNGAITRKWKVYDLERRLITGHLALKTVNTHLEGAKSEDAPEEVLSMLDLLVTFCVDRIARIAEEYRAKAEEAGIVPNENLINNGFHEKTIGPLQQHTMYESVQYDLEP